MTLRDLLFVVTIAGVAASFVGGVLRSSPGGAAVALPVTRATAEPTRPEDVAESVARLNEAFQRQWKDAGVEVAPKAPELAVLRRLSLALTGTIPSLEEIRRFEARSEADRYEAWVDGLLSDRRTSDYLAERLARAYVGTEDGPFLIFRRRRFTTWLSDELQENRRYDQIVRELLTDQGLWTDRPATNFTTVTYTEDLKKPDPERLAARVSRAFLGSRIDCAQCHDHPFREWKQADFRGLAAFFGGTYSSPRGIRDGESDYRPGALPDKPPPPVVAPAVPFLPALLPTEGGPRERLAAWVIDPSNKHLALATANRAWALMMGRPLSDPVDDLPAESELPEVLTLLADDFAKHGYDLRRLFRVIALSDAFRLDSAMGDGEGPTDRQEAVWSAFPLTRLRPEQVAGAVDQCASLATIGPESSWVRRLVAYTSRNDFVKRYGDTGEDEFASDAGTIPQRLLLMNGELVQERTKADIFTAGLRIAQQAPDDRAVVEVSYLTVLTRRPTLEELDHFAKRLEGSSGDERAEHVSDLFWTLLNSTEFSWNH